MSYCKARRHQVYNRMVLSDRSGIFSISIGGFKGIFVEKLRRIGDKSKFLIKIFWMISQRQIAYVLSWNITYFCAKFQLLTLHRLRFYKGQTGRTKKTLRHIYKYIESPQFWKNFFYIKDLFSIKTQVKMYAKVFVKHIACILVEICHD